MTKHTAGLAVLLAALAAAALVSCANGNDNESSISSEPESSVVLEEGFSLEKAEELVRETLPLDFENTYTLSVNDENREWNGRSYYHFLISDEMVTLETSVLVDQENQQIFTYYPDGSAYAPEDDPICKAAQNPDGSETSENSGQEQAEQTVEWKGSYQNSSGITLSIEPQDTTSFEFSLLDENGTGLEQQIARVISEDGTAQSTSTDRLTVTFTQKDGVVTIETEGTLPDGFSPDGEYLPIME